MPATESSILTVLRERASLKPNNTAFTFLDYQQDWNGVTESVTWSQLYRRVLNVAGELNACGSMGDRAVILAPQSVDYIAAFLGALQAGLIAVPLSVPTGGIADDRVSSVLRDASPSVILTTSAVVGDVSEYAKPQSGESAAAIVEIDSLETNSSSGRGAGADRPSVAYLQYTSGSTRQPAGVMISHKNLRANIKQVMSDYFGEYGKVAPPDTTVVSWLPFFHDMGLIVGICLPILAGIPAVLIESGVVLAAAGAMDAIAGNQRQSVLGGTEFRVRLGGPQDIGRRHGRAGPRRRLHILNGSERVQPATLKHFTDRFARFNLQPKAVRPSYGLAEALVYVATRKTIEPPKLVHFESEKLSSGTAERCESTDGHAVGQLRHANSPPCASSIAIPGSSARPER